MTFTPATYADNWRDEKNYEVRILRRRFHFIKVEWLEGPDKGHSEWLSKVSVQEDCLHKPRSWEPGRKA